MKRFLPIAKIAAGAFVGYALSHHISHPNGRVRKHVPLMKWKNVQVTPNLLIATKDRKWHIHHWAYLPARYLPLITLVRPLMRKHLMHGFVLGAILHGLTFADRFSFTFQEA